MGLARHDGERARCRGRKNPCDGWSSNERTGSLRAVDGPAEMAAHPLQRGILSLAGKATASGPLPSNSAWHRTPWQVGCTRPLLTDTLKLTHRRPLRTDVTF